MAEIIVIVHNIRSTHNIGAIFRTCEGFGVNKIILSGYSPYPQMENDNRLPHIAKKLDGQIHKTALGAEKMVDFEYVEQLDLATIKATGFKLVALEQSEKSIWLRDYAPPEKVALLLGEEVHGISDELISQCDDIVEIPMRGQKESFNVSVAAAIALYELSI